MGGGTPKLLKVQVIAVSKALTVKLLSVSGVALPLQDKLEV